MLALEPRRVGRQVVGEVWKNGNSRRLIQILATTHNQAEALFLEIGMEGGAFVVGSWIVLLVVIVVGSWIVRRWRRRGKVINVRR